MQIVIDIDEKIYNRYMNYTENYVDFMFCGAEEKIVRAIRNGTPLPKVHGDLIDRDAIEVLRIGNIKREYDKGFDAGVSCMVNRILDAPTIIEADECTYKETGCGSCKRQLDCPYEAEGE